MGEATQRVKADVALSKPALGARSYPGGVTLMESTAARPPTNSALDHQPPGRQIKPGSGGGFASPLLLRNS